MVVTHPPRRSMRRRRAAGRCDDPLMRKRASGRVPLLDDVGHAPQLDVPAETADLVLGLTGG